MLKSAFVVFLIFQVWICAGLGKPIIDFFRIVSEHNAPAGWYPSKQKAFVPLPEVKYLEEEGKTVMWISNVQGSEGARFDCYTRHPVLAGDQLLVRIEARGRGTGNFTVQAYSGKKWMGYIGIKTYELSEDWATHELVFDIRNQVETTPTDAAICLIGANKGAELFLRSITVERIAEISGKALFPNIWSAFLPMDANYQPDSRQLREIPEVLNAVGVRKIQFNGNEHDFAADFEHKPGPLEHGAGNCVWLYGEIHAEQEEEYTIGAGADWWMQMHVNGDVVIDTLETGNGVHPPRITDYKANVQLRKGKNILAIKYLTGGGSSILALGGPEDLRGIGQKLRIVEVLCKDDFETVDQPRKGNPHIQPGKASFALVSPSLEAVYTAAPKVAFALSRSEYTMPKIASGNYFATSLRLINFVEESGGGGILTLNYEEPGTGQSCRLEIRSDPADSELKITVVDLDKTLETCTYPAELLPVDILFAANASGEYRLSLETLVDSSVRHFSGEGSFFAGLNDRIFTASASLQALPGRELARVVLDDFSYGYAMPEVLKKLIPMDIPVEQTFDPVKAGWKLKFADEFEGTELDRSKWYIDGHPDTFHVQDGILELQVTETRTGDKTAYKGGGFFTYEFFQYGYFEARLRFRRNEGWNTAFWLYGGQTGNSFLDGMEIDIYEDYYVTPESPRLDFNFHGFVGRIMKSWNYLADIPGSLEDFHTIACKWTPLEITCYLNGKAIPASANHSPHKTVTFDALNHRVGFAPLRVCLHGTTRELYGRGKPIEDKGKFPDSFKVDYVRIYEYPRDEDPEVKLSREDSDFFVAPGEKFTIEAAITPNAKTGAPIKGVYLFDSGCLLDYIDKPPYKFSVSIDENYYSGTNYMRTGRSKEAPNLMNVLHAYAIYAQDANGKVAHSEAVMKMTPPERKSTPYQGVAQVIPGKLNVCHYDEGGNGVGYLDDNINVNHVQNFRPDEGVDATGEWIGHVVTGEWINLTVDIQKAGKYTVSMDYGAPAGYGGSMLMCLDDEQLLGTFDLPNNRGTGWGGLQSTLKHIEMPAGRHVIKLIVIGAFNYSYLDFVPEEP